MIKIDIQREREIIKLEVAGYSRGKAEKLLEKYSCDELYHYAVIGKKVNENIDVK